MERDPCLASAGILGSLNNSNSSTLYFTQPTSPMTTPHPPTRPGPSTSPLSFGGPSSSFSPDSPPAPSPSGSLSYLRFSFGAAGAHKHAPGPAPTVPASPSSGMFGGVLSGIRSALGGELRGFWQALRADDGRTGQRRARMEELEPDSVKRRKLLRE